MEETEPPKDKDETFWGQLAKTKQPPKRPTQSGFIRMGFLFSLFLAGVLATQSFDGFTYSKKADGEEISLKTKTPDVIWLVICAPLIGWGLGLEIDKTEIGKAMAEVARRLLGNGEAK